MSDFDPRAELAALVAGFRAHLEWQRRAGTYGAPAARSPRVGAAGEAAETTADDSLPAAPTLDEIRRDLGDCTRCKLSATRNKIVFGVGSESAALMFVGEAPGAQEDRQGEPFVGPAGELLDRMIAAMGWSREDVYIANVLKCRPPRNRSPQPDETAACEPFLARQIEAVRPRIIVTLGKPAAQLLLRTNAPISALRGRFDRYRGIAVMPTFHPAYLLRQPERKRDAWEDLKKVIDELERLGVTPPLSPRR